MNTTQELLKRIENLNFKGYRKYFNKNSNQDYNHLQNFFIWKRADRKNEYLRVCLMSKGWREKQVLYWAIDFNFKPFNKKKCDKWKSKEFKESETELYIIYFEEAVNNIREFLKGGLKE